MQAVLRAASGMRGLFKVDHVALSVGPLTARWAVFYFILPDVIFVRGEEPGWAPRSVCSTGWPRLEPDRGYWRQDSRSRLVVRRGGLG